MNCIVCHSAPVSHSTKIDGQTYWRCVECHSIFLDQTHYPSACEERAHYQKYDNRIDDPACRKFLWRLLKHLMPLLKPRGQGLEFGCGLGPALAAMLSEQGQSMTLYDPFFHPDEPALMARYDFITCNETAEHFHDPFAEFNRLDNLLKPQGYPGVMTCFSTQRYNVENCHYWRDPTNVIF